MRLKKLDLNVNIIYKGECKKNQDVEFDDLDTLYERKKAVTVTGEDYGIYP